MLTADNVETLSHSEPGSSSNVIQLGSLIANIILGFIIVLMWLGRDDRQIDNRFDDIRDSHASEVRLLDEHFAAQITVMRADYQERIDHLEKQNRDYASQINEFETYQFNHVSKIDGVLVAHGVDARWLGHPKSPPQR